VPPRLSVGTAPHGEAFISPTHSLVSIAFDKAKASLANRRGRGAWQCATAPPNRNFKPERRKFRSISFSLAIDRIEGPLPGGLHGGETTPDST
jgi:hypothetical protein